MAEGGHDRQVPAQQVSADRDSIVAGRDVVFTNNLPAAGGSRHGGRAARFQARVDQAVEGLALAIDDQWRREERLRRIPDPVPLTVSWKTAARELSDHAENIGESESGSLDLDGSLDRVVDVFTSIRSRRLAVLGSPGAGKTVFALRLTLNLLARRKPGDPVPVIFGLHTWHPQEQQSLQGWMAARLAADYPALRYADKTGRTIADELVSRRLILPVLDGLDEIPRALRADAMRVLNLSLDSDAPVIVTCRLAEYQQLVNEVDVLTSAAVIELLPLDIDDLAIYLPRTTRQLPSGAAPGSGTKWGPVIERLRNEPDDQPCKLLLEVLSTPLMTSLARAAYSDTPAHPRQLLDGGFADRAGIETHLLTAFVPAAFATPVTSADNRERRNWHPEDAERWLRFLARHLNRLQTQDLEWWRLPEALLPPARWLAPGLLIWVTVGVAFGTVSGFPVFWAVGAIGSIGLMTGLALAATGSPTDKPAIPRAPRPNWRRLLSTGAVFAALGIITSTTVPLAQVSAGPEISQRYLLYASIFVLFIGLAIGAALGASGIDTRQLPTITPLKGRRRLRTLSRRLFLAIGIGFFNGLLISLALGASWGIGFAATQVIRLETARNFPDGAQPRPGYGGTYADYPETGLRYVILGNGQREIKTITGTPFFYGPNGSNDIYFNKNDCTLSEIALCRSTGPEKAVITSRNSAKLSALGIGYGFSDTSVSLHPRPRILGKEQPSLGDDASVSTWLNDTVKSQIRISSFLAGEITWVTFLPSSAIGILLLWLGLPVDEELAISPASTVRADRSAALFRGSVLTFLALSAYLIFAHYYPIRLISAPSGRWVILCVALGLLAVTLSAWARLRVASAWLAVRGKLPWRLTRFLEDAHARGVLRQSGAAYQFRHVRLQEQLAGTRRLLDLEDGSDAAWPKQAALAPDP